MYKRELSNLSYTNKDFGQIYPELLDLAKKISYKWDPSLSDESDPGVVLLKLAALMADKCNYNIDKNVLELFPMSVTQLANARQLFDQCGYTMRYFQSATTPLTFEMSTEPEITDKDLSTLLPDGLTVTLEDIATDVRGDYLRHYIIPKYTMFSDIDNSIVYTILEEVDIPSNGNAVTVDAVQGTIHEYSVNGSNIITADMLDENNRVYFTELNIPENGIFIENVSRRADENDELDLKWKQSDNLLIEPLAKKCYKFGLSLDGTRCYVEFPTDADTLLGDGVTIHYLQTSGTDGNIKRKFISQFFAETKAERKINNFADSQTIDITSDNVYIYNEFSALNGRNPESIEDAYKNYQKVKTTFNTLVSTQDYSNFLVSKNALSNCVVCDRSDDIQSAYDILTNVEGEHQRIPQLRKKTISHVVTDDSGNIQGSYDTVEPELTAFDLRVYGLKYDGSVFEDYKHFSRSFDLYDVRQDAGQLLTDHTSQVKCLSHDYREFVPDRIILLKNRYPILAKIVSPYKLALSQQEEILNTVKLKLFQILNSRVIEFGQEIDYNLVYDTILKADPRISAVILEDIKYETYAVYLNGSTNMIEHLRIDADSNEPEGVGTQADYLRELWKKFRTDVYTRSVLAGKTPLFIPDGVFIYSLAHEHAQNGASTYDVNNMSSEVDIPLRWSHTNNSLTSRVLAPNDVVTLTAPNLIMDKRYANYCQFITNIGCTALDETTGQRVSIRPDFSNIERKVVIPKNMEYTLQPHEYIIFFWRTTDDDTEPYKYVKYTGRNASEDNPVVICPSWNMLQQPHTANIDTYTFQIYDDFFMKLGDKSETQHVEGVQLEIGNDYQYTYESVSNKDSTNTLKLTLNRLISKYFIGDRFNVKSNAVEVKKINKIHLNNKETGTNKFYWVLNHETEDSQYRLFSSDPNDKEYTLKDGETLIYSNDRMTQLYVLGAGTKIERDTSANVVCTTWQVPALEHKMEYISKGPEYFKEDEHPWFNLTTSAPGYNLYATEMIYKKLGADTQLVISPPEDGTLTESAYCITKDGIRAYGSEIDSEFHTEHCSFTVINEFGDEEKLPDRKTLALAWKVSSSLNINMSYDDPQRLYANQTVSWQPVGESGWYSLTGSDTSEIYIQADRPTTHVGGSNIDVRYYNILNEVYEPLSIYIYKLKDVDMFLSSDTNNYDAVWKFSDEEIAVTGDDVVLTNITLPEGSYILPISIDNVDPNGITDTAVTATWTRLRKLKASKLKTEEQALMQTLQTTGSSSGVGNVGKTDWHAARKPIELSDVAKWVYGYANVDISDEFGLHTARSLFDILFVEKSSTADPGQAAKKFELRDTASDMYNSDFARMLKQHGGTLFDRTNMDPLGSYNIGDIVVIQKLDPSSDFLEEEPEELIWIYAPTTVAGSTDVFIRVSSAGICDRATVAELKSKMATAAYHYTLRPSDVEMTLKDDSGANSSVLKTVTEVPVDRNSTYYYMLSVGASTSSYTLSLKYTGQSDVHPTYRILNPVKYTQPKLSETAENTIDFFEDILRELKTLDSNSMFNYTYEVPDDELVSYPLNSLAFLNSDHPMNKFTICQYVINESKRVSELVVSGKSR